MTDIIQAKKTAPLGYHDTNAGILPNEWTSRPLSSIVEEITETAGTRKIETVSISAGVGFVNQAEKFGKELSGKQYEKYTVLHRGDFSYNKGNSNLYPQGCIYRLNDRTEAAVPNVFESFRVSDGNPDFYEQLFISGFLNRQLYSRINRGVRDDGLLNLRGNDFYSCEVPYPPLAEQERIAEILMQCDKVIELCEKKLVETKKLKKTCLRWMFPENGDKAPKLRFSGYTNDWELSKIGLHARVLSAARVHKHEWTPTGIPFFRSSDVVSAYKGTPNEKAFISIELYEELIKTSGELEEGDILVTGGGSIGIPYIVPDNTPLYSKDADLIWIKKSKDVDSMYLFSYLESAIFRKHIESISHVGTIAHYTIEQVKATPIALPSHDEQVRIGDFFQKLNSLIELYDRELNEHKMHKKATLQLLLTGIVRTKV